MIREHEGEDAMALQRALVAMRTCPTCRHALRPVAFCSDVWGCAGCHETWYIPPKDDEGNDGGGEA